MNKSISEIESSITDIENRIKHLSKWKENFETQYIYTFNSLDSLNPTLRESNSQLSNYIYIIPDDKKVVNVLGFRPLFKLKHNMTPFTILYDSKDGSVEHIENTTLSILSETAKSFSRINSRGLCDQFAVDFISHSEEFEKFHKELFNNFIDNFVASDKSSLGSNQIGIAYLSKKMDELPILNRLNKIVQDAQTMIEGETSISEINPLKKERKEKLYKYTVLYFIIPPEYDFKFTESINAAISNADLIGFIPIFICSKSDWVKGEQIILKEIKKLTTNVLDYNGKTYSLYN